jgi:hypothetical protein
MSLLLDWVGYDAAKYACEKWHYSKCVPVGKSNTIGVWENERYIGCIIFSYGANHNMAKQYCLDQTECVELTRIALTIHKTPVSKLVSIALKILHKKNPELKLIVSYADPEQGHLGSVYQAGNWIFTGTSLSALKVWYKGKWAHKKTVDDAGINQEFLKKRVSEPKYKYLYPLTDDMRLKIEPLRKPYPKKAIKNDEQCVSNVTGSISSFHEERGGSSPTLTHESIDKSVGGVGI